MLSDYTVGRIEQLTLAHESARPKHNNPAWVNTHRDLGIALDEIKRLTDEGAGLRAALMHIKYASHTHMAVDYAEKALACIYPDPASDKQTSEFSRFIREGTPEEKEQVYGRVIDESIKAQSADDGRWERPPDEGPPANTYNPEHDAADAEQTDEQGQNES